MINRIVVPEGSPRPGGAYSQVVIANGFVFVAGQSPTDASTQQVPEDFDAQVRQTLSNLKTALEAAGSDLEHVVKVNAYLSSLERFQEYNRIYKQIMPEGLPARTTIATALIGMDVEIDCIAVLKNI